MSAAKSPVVWDREKKTLFEEKVYGGDLVHFLYSNPIGRVVEFFMSSSPFPSRLYGHYQDSDRSRHVIPEFIKKFEIPMQEYEDREFRSFNDFFIRKFRPGLRPFVDAAELLPAPCEARYTFIDSLALDHRLNVKGFALDPVQLIGDKEVAKDFVGGPAAIARLCPVDYHRFHYPDTGTTLKTFRIGGALHSVNPKALELIPDLLLKNERQVTILQTVNFGKIAYIEVGATCVGKIVQTHSNDKPFARGEEKGYFLFGGSTVIIVGQRGAWRWDSDLQAKANEGHEVFVKMGRAIGSKMV